MVKVTCRFCKKRLLKDEAVKVPHGKVHWYYCPEHARIMDEQDSMYERINDIFGYKITDNSSLYGQINPLISEHGIKKISHYLQSQRDWLVRTMSKEFTSEYGKIRYFVAILRNNLPDYKFKEEVINHKDQQYSEMVPTNKFKKNKRVGLEDLL